MNIETKSLIDRLLTLEREVKYKSNYTLTLHVGKYGEDVCCPRWHHKAAQWDRSAGEGCQHSLLDGHAWFAQSGSIKEHNYFSTSCFLFSGLGVCMLVNWIVCRLLGVILQGHRNKESSEIWFYTLWIRLTVVSTEMPRDCGLDFSLFFYF